MSARPSASRRPLKVHVIGPDNALATLVHITGFISLVGFAAGFDPTGQHIHPDSQFGIIARQPTLRIVLVEHPARPIDPEVDLPAVYEHVRGQLICTGESLGGRLAAMLHQYAIQQRNGSDADVGLALLSVPHMLDHLQPKAQRGIVAINRLHLPNWAGRIVMPAIARPLTNSFNYPELLAREGHPERLPDCRRSYARSHWALASCRKLAETEVSGPPHPANQRVIIGFTLVDNTINNVSVRQWSRRQYPSCFEYTIEDAIDHASAVIYPWPYQRFWRDVLAYFYRLWGLSFT